MEVDKKMTECECSCDDIKKIVKEIVTELFNERLVKTVTEMKQRKKRAPSQYNIFIGGCMKQPGKNMKTCASEYRQHKGKTSEKPASSKETFDIDTALFGE